MNKDSLIDDCREGIPDEEMPELSEEDFAGAKPNRFARHIFALDEDVAAHFKTQQEVNEALRLVIKLGRMVTPA